MSRVKKNTLTILLIAVALIVAIMLWIMTRDKSTYMPSVPVARASDALAALSADMPLYTVDAVYDPSAHKLTGTQSVSFTTTGQQLTSIILRAYANAYSSEDTSPAAVPELFLASYGGVFDKGGIAVSAFTVNGEPKAFRYADDYNILIEVADVAIAPLSSVELSFNFSLTLPKLKGAFSYSGDTAILSNPFPILAEIDEFGWITDSVPLYGDGYASKPNNWRVNITAPEGYTVAGSGSPETEGGAIVAYASRGFSFFAGKAGQVSADVNGIIVTVLGSNASSILSEARDIISYYEDVYGKYPWQSLVVLSADIPQDYIVGSCFIVINSKLKDRTLPPAEAVAKQYFGELAGSDNLGQPWLSESVSAFASAMYMKSRKGEDAYQKYIMEKIEPSFRLTIPSGILIGSPLYAFQSNAEIRVLLRERGLMMLHGLAEAVGEDKMNDALRRYVSANAFGAAYREDFMQAVREAVGFDWSGYLTDYLDTNVGGSY